jgi:uncharacterized protein (UPF0276 family)
MAPSCGIGLRHQHYTSFLQALPDLSWVEVHPENYRTAASRQILEKVREKYGISFHGVGLSLGSAHRPCKIHLTFLKQMIDRFDPFLWSEHASWSRWQGFYLNDLLPLPYTEESLSLLVANIHEAQDYMGRHLLIENPASYVSFSHSTYNEADFLIEVAKQTGCGILLDLNNIYVSAQNLKSNAEAYIRKFPPSLIYEIHLAGHRLLKVMPESEILIDDHGGPVDPEVWYLYEVALDHVGPKFSIIEWDNQLPSLDVLLQEAKKANQYLQASSGQP